MTMNSPLAEVCCASFPAESLAWLAPLRVHAGIRVRTFGERAWLWWTSGDEVVLQRVLALHDVAVFGRREGRWYRPGQHLPAFDVPSEEGARPLLHVLTPAPVQPDYGAPSLRALALRLVPDGCPRAAWALGCTLADLAGWADQATSRQLAMLTAVRSGPRVLLRGERLPPLLEAERYWGRTILIRLGFRPEPEVSEGVLRQALRLQDEEIALLGANGFEAIDARRFQPLTRAGVRLALREER
jgi:hypothetical protein